MDVGVLNPYVAHKIHHLISMMCTGKAFVCFTIRQTRLKSKFSWNFVLSHVSSCTMLIILACWCLNSYFAFCLFPISVFTLSQQMSHACWFHCMTVTGIILLGWDFCSFWKVNEQTLSTEWGCTCMHLIIGRRAFINRQIMFTCVQVFFFEFLLISIFVSPFYFKPKVAATHFTVLKATTLWLKMVNAFFCIILTYNLAKNIGIHWFWKLSHFKCKYTQKKIVSA